tara:strand:- start:1992 stop:2306 length:315 start_codon:yes stop_codon:yes gene_type:complete
MDLSQLKKQSDISYDIVTAKKNALEKIKSRQLVVYNKLIFVATPELINYISALKARLEKFVILDCNSNPCEINNPEEFLRTIIERNQEALNEYHTLYQTFTKRV